MSTLSEPTTSKEYNSTPESSSEEAEQIKKKRKRKSYVQKYNSGWEQESEFKGWLHGSKKGPNFAYCKACNKDFVCGKSEIEKHSVGKRHTKLAKTLRTQKTLTEMPSQQRKYLSIRKLKLLKLEWQHMQLNIMFLSVL